MKSDAKMEDINNSGSLLDVSLKVCCDSKEKEVQSEQISESSTTHTSSIDSSLLQISESSMTTHFDKTNNDCVHDYSKNITNEEMPLIPSKPSLLFNDLKVLTGSWSEFNPKEGLRNTELFLKGCKWAPDGTCLLTNSNDTTIRLFDLPLELYNCNQISKCDFPELKPSIRTKVGGQVYDFGWYPLMSSLKPDTCCFVTTSFHAPVQIWDAYTGTLRCSYRGYNQQDELDAALSVMFHPSGDLLLCGYRDNVKIFNTDVPGRDFTTISTKEVCDQKGIVSCIAVNPSMPNIFAAGTYSRTVGLYSVDGNALCLLSGQSGGLTQLLFSHDGSLLISAGRKDSEILCWDLRNLGHTLWVARRPHTTNQRLYMDLSSDERYLLAGSSDGQVYVWDLHAAPTACSTPETNAILEPITKWKAHNDCVNGLSVHRHIPLIATASGQRYIPEIVDSSDNEELLVIERSPENCEDCVKLWWAGTISENSKSVTQNNSFELVH